jgi:SSS family solute:Na+ symporter
MALIAVVFILYTFWGGQVSVIRTDRWQFVFFIGSLLVGLAFLLASYGSGASHWTDIPEGHWRFPVSPSFGWYEVLIFYPLVLGLPYLVGPDIYSRVLCARNDRVARKAALTAAGIVVPVSFLLALTGVLVCGRLPDLLPEAALPTAVAHLVPVGLKGLVTAGFLGAIMSSADTALMSAATILSVNVVSPLGGFSQQAKLILTRVALVGIGGAAWVLAGLQQGIINSLLLAFTVFVGGLALPTLASFSPKHWKVTSSGAMWAVVCGGLVAVLGKVEDGLLLRRLLADQGDAFFSGALGPQYPSILPVAVSFVVMMVVSRMEPTDR